MALFALISNGSVIQTGAEAFPVSQAFEWVDATMVSPPPQPGWTYNGSVFVASAAAATDMRPAAQAALDRSDITVIRCYEHVVAVPAEWVAYRDALRAVVAGGPTSATLPAQPAYPAGT